MKKNRLSYFVLTGPAVIMFSFVMIIPFVLGVYYSFTDWSAIVGKNLNFVGLKKLYRFISRPRVYIFLWSYP